MKKFIVIDSILHRIEVSKAFDTPKNIVLSPQFTMEGLKFEVKKNFEIPEKLFGGIEERVDEILDAYAVYGRTGILLEGTKGTGKTLTAKMCAIKSELPCVIIDKKFSPEQLRAIYQELNVISERAIIIYDEFEKWFNDLEQETFLTLLDGTVENKFLSMICTNEDINDLFYNRTKRILYHYSFKCLEEKEIKDILKSTLKNKDLILKVENILKFFPINFDNLSRVISEINRGKKIKRVFEILNIKKERKYYIFKGFHKNTKDSFEKHLQIDPFKYETFSIFLENKKGEMKKVTWDLSKDTIESVNSEFIITTKKWKISVKEHKSNKELKLT